MHVRYDFVFVFQFNNRICIIDCDYSILYES